MLTTRDRVRKHRKRLLLFLRTRRRAAYPIFICGAQRSGTNMLIRAFNRHPLAECFYETDEEAFDNYVLRDDATVTRLISRSWGKVAVFKPISDSQHARRLLQLYPDAHIIWLFRQWRDVVNSALRNFKEHQGELRIMATDPKAAGWRVEEIEPEVMDMVRRYFARGVSDASARAIQWYTRNHHFFRQQLQHNPQVHLVNYELLVRNPEAELHRLCTLTGLEWSVAMVGNIHQGSVRKNPSPDVDPEIAEMCDRMAAELMSSLEAAGPH